MIIEIVVQDGLGTFEFMYTGDIYTIYIIDLEVDQIIQWITCD